MQDKMFEKSFDRVIGHEGGFQKMHGDRGNWTSGAVGKGELKGTKFGLSAMTYPDLDIESLTVEDAKGIYYRDWWLSVPNIAVISLSDAMLYQMFDAAINHGQKNAYKILQRAVGVDDDGIFGRKTLKAIGGIDELSLPLLFIAERISFFTKIKTFDEYGRGWMNRMAENLKYAVEDSCL